MDQHTYLINTTAGMTYLVVEEDEDVEEVYDRFKNDEAGADFKEAELLSYEKIN